MLYNVIYTMPYNNLDLLALAVVNLGEKSSAKWPVSHLVFLLPPPKLTKTRDEWGLNQQHLVWNLENMDGKPGSLKLVSVFNLFILWIKNALYELFSDISLGGKLGCQISWNPSFLKEIVHSISFFKASDPLMCNKHIEFFIDDAYSGKRI